MSGPAFCRLIRWFILINDFKSNLSFWKEKIAFSYEMLLSKVKTFGGKVSSSYRHGVVFCQAWQDPKGPRLKIWGKKGSPISC